MAIVTLPNLGPDPFTVNASVLNGKVDPLATDYNGNIDNTNIVSSAAIANSKLNLSAVAQSVSMSAKDFTEAKSADIASATTTTIWATDGNFAHITGTTTITSFGTAEQAGDCRTVVFDGILTLTHNGTSLILPTGANITTAAGDTAIVRAETTANARVIAYLRKDGTALSVTATSIAPTDYRSGIGIVQASTTTMTVALGILDVGGTRIAKTSSTTTLTLTTAGNWAGGSSLQATSTYGYVGVDISGNIKMHTTAPTHSDYAVSVTAGVKRYATWSSTVYRIIGWFYMNATGSGELNSWEVGNIKEMSVANCGFQNASSTATVNDTSYGTDLTSTIMHIYVTGANPTRMSFQSQLVRNAADTLNTAEWNIDTSSDTASTKSVSVHTNTPNHIMDIEYIKTLAQGVHTIFVEAKVDANACDYTIRSTMFQEL